MCVWSGAILDLGHGSVCWNNWAPGGNSRFKTRENAEDPRWLEISHEWVYIGKAPERSGEKYMPKLTATFVMFQSDSCHTGVSVS